MSCTDKSLFIPASKNVFPFKVIETLSLLPYLSASPSSFSLKNKTKKDVIMLLVILVSNK